jgi:hypothetical protein
MDNHVGVELQVSEACSEWLRLGLHANSRGKFPNLLFFVNKDGHTEEGKVKTENRLESCLVKAKWSFTCEE